MMRAVVMDLRSEATSERQTELRRSCFCGGCGFVVAGDYNANCRAESNEVQKIVWRRRERKDARPERAVT